MIFTSRKITFLCIIFFCSESVAAQTEASEASSEVPVEATKTEAPVYRYPVSEWLMHSSLNNAPLLLKGICNYLVSSSDDPAVPSFHRLILVGEPGTGKTTLAYAIGDLLKRDVTYVGATFLRGRFRNETAVNMRNFFHEKINKNGRRRRVIIIDELDKLFENYTNDRSDDAENAAAFWLILDELEKRHPHIIVIGTMNDASKLPPQIKSRFHGKIITMPLPSKKQKIQAFKDILNNDHSIQLTDDVNDAFILQLIDQWRECSLRDVKMLIDTAKMFRYAEGDNLFGDAVITLNQNHFKQALNQLCKETTEHKQSFLTKHYETINRLSVLTSLMLNGYRISEALISQIKTLYGLQWKTTQSK